ncbi:MAG: hypothetical protein NC416_02895 [Eubacterium sp.]|nr:hypothetical protein [Eubacterium sp.]
MANEQMMEQTKVRQEDISVKVNAGIRFTLLKNNFVAALQKDEEALSILLVPTNAPGEKGITIREMVDEIKEMIGAGDDDPEVNDMTKQLEDTVNSVGNQNVEGGFHPMEIEIFLQQAFLYYRLGKNESGGDESGNSAKTLEYAFSLRVDTTKMLKKMDFFSLDEITLSVWKTDRKKVTESMNMFLIEDFLQEEKN